MKIFIRFVLAMLAGSAAFAGTQKDVFGCKGAAVKAALSQATQDRPDTKITYVSIPAITLSNKAAFSRYEVSLAQWSGDDSFGLSYEVLVRGKAPKCKVVHVELTAEE